ncbi:ankyrin repeat-containing domain protein [Trichoderma longibrachiatum]|uniref:Ankyrin n=1 Tax=Trichoderma longibrachiatum ATCC 18648 TaxID=983965 RepID=A0A2T4CK84_TRILO|nr:ankyrin [Trichoderma longibrachiatum ATCC 18648]
MAEEIHRLIKANEPSEVKEAVKGGNLINEFSAAGLTPLGTAIVCENLAIARLLLENGADISLGYNSDLCLDKSRMQSELPDICPPIHMASAMGLSDHIRLLVEYGADVNDPSAVEYGAQMLPLYLSTKDATKTLIDLAADVCRKNSTGFTPLLHAIAREDITSTRLLVENGADVEVERTTRYRLRVATGYNAEQAEERLVEGSSSPLMVACHQGRLRPTSAQMIQILAAAGANINRRFQIKNVKEEIGFTALSLICGSRTPAPLVKGAYAKKDQYGEKEVAAIKALIAAGADIDNPPVVCYVCDGDMPFLDFKCRLEVIRALVCRGMKTDIQVALEAQLSVSRLRFQQPEAQDQLKLIQGLLSKV